MNCAVQLRGSGVLEEAHTAVALADLNGEDLLARLLALNLVRAAAIVDAGSRSNAR